ncbi:hypothetical protein L3Y34_009699 [Caenorhabditis briggsae]|uniref:7TM GPCR serpentine receptor class x (Srx) domain-containing protein n=1 Tax=Caenorhabditis briggsae TaxID=6238 RepID=A0AAE9D3A7_CAEBR|nr:hypothetical protein L3Y34_009699 [Caenorhabditis briggsae]
MRKGRTTGRKCNGKHARAAKPFNAPEIRQEKSANAPKVRQRTGNAPRHPKCAIVTKSTVNVIKNLLELQNRSVRLQCAKSRAKAPKMRPTFYKPVNCRLSYTHFGWLFTSDLTIETCGSKYRTFLLSSQSALSFMILAADVATIILLVLKRNVLGSMSKEARRTERNFALQVLLQGVVFNAHSIWISNAFQWLPGDSNEWKLFFTSTFSSNLLMIFDPAVVIVFNREFRQWLFTSRSTVFVATISASQRSPKSTPKNTTNANSIMVVSPFNAN